MVLTRSETARQESIRHEESSSDQRQEGIVPPLVSPTGDGERVTPSPPPADQLPIGGANANENLNAGKDGPQVTCASSTQLVPPVRVPLAPPVAYPSHLHTVYSAPLAHPAYAPVVTGAPALAPHLAYGAYEPYSAPPPIGTLLAHRNAASFTAAAKMQNSMNVSRTPPTCYGNTPIYTGAHSSVFDTTVPSFAQQQVEALRNTQPVHRTRRVHVDARSQHSNRSTASLKARLQQAELTAQERLTAIKQQHLLLEENLIKKQLEVERAQIQAEIEAESDEESIPDVPPPNPTINEWLDQTIPRRGEPPTSSALAPPKERELERQALERRARREPWERQHPHMETPLRRQERTPSPPPTGRRRSEGRAIEQLAEAIQNIARPPPKQAAELPIFSGGKGEWLPFKAAMRDSTKLYKYSAAENLARLRVCLRGEAREKVSGMLHAATDPEEIMELLEQCYGSPEAIIEKAITDLRRLPRPGNAATDLNEFAVKVKNSVSVLRALNRPSYLMDLMVTREIASKLSPHLQARWGDYAAQNGTKSPGLEMLAQFLFQEAGKALQYVATDTGARKETLKTGGTQAHKKKNPVYATTADNEKLKCPCCEEEHLLTGCTAFKKMDVDERWNVVKKAVLCFKCITRRHRRSSCKGRPCGVNGCRRPHHELLHSERAPQPVEDKETVMSVATTSPPKKQVLLKVCPVVVSGPQGEIRTFALLDEGSTITLIDEDLANMVGAEGPTRPLHIQGVGAPQREGGSREVRIKLRGCAQDNVFSVSARTLKNLSLHSQTIRPEVLKYQHLRHLDAREVCQEMARPKILIGADNWHLMISRELRIGRRNEPAASLTDLGWVIYGTSPRVIHKSADDTVLHIREQSTHQQLEDMVRDHINIDSLGVRLIEKKRPMEERALEIFNKTSRRIGDHFEVGLPWRSDNVNMPDNYPDALNRLRQIEKKMDRDPDFKKAYTKEVEQLLEKKYAVECDGSEKDSPVRWFLPHFGVKNPNKPGKLRMVFDAAATYKGTSLNKQLLEGPDLLLSLTGVLFRFRERPIAVTADVQEMFLQIKIRKEDQPAQMFLWRGEERNRPPRRLKMTSMIFGASSSPFLAHSVRNKNARDFADTHPRALEAITQSHYMDDFIDSYVSEEEAVKTAEEVDEVHQRAGFYLRAWNSNSLRVLERVPEERRARTPTRLAASQCPTEKTLGMLWDPQTDELGFNTALNRVPEEVKNAQRAPTKREALSLVMSIYDPLGLLSHFTITAKIMLQNLWRLKLAWDEPIPHQEADMFSAWLQNLDKVAKLRIPRCYSKENAVRKELHVFCDASEEAYAAAAYWRIEKEDGTVDVILAAAKAKVAPIKVQSIPRLELQAALIGARLAETITRDHRWEASAITFWTDSRTVICWIRNETKRYTPFVAHRLGEISELTRNDQWRWIPTNENVADDATRSNLRRPVSNRRWFTGPEFLRRPADEWPIESGPKEREEEEETTCHVREEAPFLPDLNRFSKYEKLIRATARVLFFIDKLRKRANQLEVDHLERAEKLWIAKCQKDSFPEEVKLIEKGQNIPRTSRLCTLDPMVEGGLLRVRGRITAAQLPDDAKTPVILDGRHRFTKLLVEKEHQAANHANNERVVNDLRQRFWIIHLRPTVRAVAKNCALCRIRKAAPSLPPTGNLPADRVSPFCRPFTYVGMDCFGPMTVAIGRRREKRWGALFTCFTTRAVHLELVASLTTDSAIMALRRMAARRGWPRHIYSDNGTNFRGADVELRAAYKEWLPALRDYGLQRRVFWRFIPPGAPHMGGVWERLVRSIKVALAATLKERTPSEEVLQTLLAEAEHSVNARPLTHVPVQPDDSEALTPNHFLLGTSSGLPCTGPCEDVDRRKWRAAQAIADHFWRRWIREYLPTLIPRGQSEGKRRELQPDDLVIVVDPALPRNFWPRGIVVQVYPGSDGKVRSADVRTRGGVFRRPVSRLAVLPVQEAT